RTPESDKAGEDSKARERTTSESTRSGDRAPREGADRDRAEAGRDRASTDRDLGGGRKTTSHGRSRRPCFRHSATGRSRSRNHLQKRRSRSQGDERESRGVPGVQPGGGY